MSAGGHRAMWHVPRGEFQVSQNLELAPGVRGCQVRRPRAHCQGQGPGRRSDDQDPWPGDWDKAGRLAWKALEPRPVQPTGLPLPTSHGPHSREPHARGWWY